MNIMSPMKTGTDEREIDHPENGARHRMVFQMYFFLCGPQLYICRTYSVLSVSGLTFEPLDHNYIYFINKEIGWHPHIFYASCWHQKEFTRP